MIDRFNKIKQRYYKVNKYYEKGYIEDEEQKIIDNLHRKERKKYLKVNKLYIETDNLSINLGKYYRINYWVIEDEKLDRIIMMNISGTLDLIESKISLLVLIGAVIATLFVLFFVLLLIS